MADFKPSQVKPFFPNSPLQKTEKEVMAAHFVAFLAANGDDWNRPIGAKEFMEFTEREHDGMQLVYQKPFSNPFLAEGCVNAIHALAKEGYLTRREGEDPTYSVTEKFRTDFYSKYVTSAENYKRRDIAKE